MRFIDSNNLIKFSCVALMLLSSSSKLYAKPFGDVSGSWPSAFSSLFVMTRVPLEMESLEHFDTFHTSEVLIARNAGDDSGAALTELLLSSSDMGVTSAESAQLELNSSMNGMLLAEVEAVPAPESSTLFLLGLGLLGLAQIPVRKLAKRSQEHSRRTEDASTYLTAVSETSLAAAQKAHAAREHHLNA